MKKITFLLLALTLTFSVFSQRRTRSFMGWHLEKDAPLQLNEVKVNLGTTIFALFPEVSYERIMNEDFSLGASAGINLNSDDYPLSFAFTPYARWFFGGNSNSLQKYGAGFFIEANGSVFSAKHNEVSVYNDGSVYNYSSTQEDVFGAGLGLAIGWKYLTRNNWVGELMFGGGRDFVNDDAYPRVGITIGKRF